MSDAPTAEAILATRFDNADTLMGKGSAAVGQSFRRLVAIWHPDVNRDPRADEVVRHLVALRDHALGRGSSPAQASPQSSSQSSSQSSLHGTREFSSAAGGRWRMNYLGMRPFESGEIFVGRGSLSYLVAPEFDDLLENSSVQGLPFADARMRGEMERFLPKMVRFAPTQSGRVLVYRRDQDQILMSDLIAHEKGRIDPVHIAWMVSGMQNIASYLAWAGLVHGAIGPDVLLVSPRDHSVALTGPLLYLTRVGDRPRALPERTLQLVPRMAIKGVPADTAVDSELVRLTARELAGDAGGMRLMTQPDFPKPFSTWLVMPSAENDFAGWERARDAAFGPRRFVHYNLTGSDVYGS